MRKLLSLAIFLVFAFSSQAQANFSHPLVNEGFLKRIAKTLTELKSGETSTNIYPSLKDAEGLIHTQSINYLTLQTGDARRGGTYRITAGDASRRDLAAQWYKLLKKYKDGTEVWYRMVNEGGIKRPVLVARSAQKDLIFEIHSEYDKLSAGLSDIRSKMKSMLAVATDNSLLEGKVRSIDMSSLKLFGGYWTGPMKNSLGQTASRSDLTIFVGEDGSVAGDWHAGWDLEDIKVSGREMSWRHSKVGGCKDYANTLAITPDGKRAILKYEVVNHCKNKQHYTGTAWLDHKDS